MWRTRFKQARDQPTRHSRDPGQAIDTPPPTNALAERTYAVVLEQPWHVRAVFSVDANGGGTLVGPVGLGVPIGVFLGPATDHVNPGPVLPVTSSGAVLIIPTIQTSDAVNYKH
jgi:hypothetical protein